MPWADVLSRLQRLAHRIHIIYGFLLWLPDIPSDLQVRYSAWYRPVWLLKSLLLLCGQGKSLLRILCHVRSLQYFFSLLNLTGLLFFLFHLIRFSHHRLLYLLRFLSDILLTSEEPSLTHTVHLWWSYRSWFLCHEGSLSMLLYQFLRSQVYHFLSNRPVSFLRSENCLAFWITPWQYIRPPMDVLTLHPVWSHNFQSVDRSWQLPVLHRMDRSLPLNILSWMY